MAHLFVGDLPKADESVLRALYETLDDTFWIIAETNTGRLNVRTPGRQIDWLVMRAVPDERPPFTYSTIIVGEQKNTEAILTGTEDGPWTEDRNSHSQPLVMSNQDDLNPFKQAVNVANAVRYWLWNQQRLFVDPAQPELDEKAYAAWPTLLICGPSQENHRLPRKMSYGEIWYGIDAWLYRLSTWQPKRGVQLTATELAQLTAIVAETRGLHHWTPTSVEQVTRASLRPWLERRPTPAAATAVAESDDLDGPVAETPSLDWIEGFTTWARKMEERVAYLEQRLAARAAPPRRVERDDPTFTQDERELVLAAVARLRNGNRKRDFPTLFSEMRSMVGEPLKDRNFLGWGSAKNMMDQAVAEGWVKYGPLDVNGVPTVYLPNELP